MSTELVPFDFSGESLRGGNVAGEPVLIGKDVCAALGITKYRDALAQLDDDERVSITVDTLGGPQQMTAVTEAGIWTLAFISRSARVKLFRRWVAHEVLPQIRRTGSYVPEPRFEIPANYAEALELAARKVREVEALEQRNAELEPAAEAWDVLASAEGDYSVGDAAKMLSRDPMITTGQNRLFQYMRDLGWIYRRGEAWRAYQTQVDNGRLVERASEPYRHPTTGEWTLPPPQVRITAKGLMALRRELTGMAQLPISS